MSDIAALLERVRAATGPDDALDVDLTKQFYDRLEASLHEHHHLRMHEYTASVDAALALVERVLPGWRWNIGHDANDELYATLWHGVTEHNEYAASPALAILAALLLALKDQPHV